MNAKRCRVCSEEKSLDQFSKNKSTKDGLRSECKACYNIYFRQYFSNKNKMDKQIDRVKKNKKEYRWRVDQYKLELGCSKCGYNKCVGALCFHHTDPKNKEFMISKATNASISKEKFEVELDKCILLCANCHAELEEKIRRKQT